MEWVRGGGQLSAAHPQGRGEDGDSLCDSCDCRSFTDVSFISVLVEVSTINKTTTVFKVKSAWIFTLKEKCELRGTDNFQEQIPVFVVCLFIFFTRNLRYHIYYLSNICLSSCQNSVNVKVTLQGPKGGVTRALEPQNFCFGARIPDDFDTWSPEYLITVKPGAPIFLSWSPGAPHILGRSPRAQNFFGTLTLGFALNAREIIIFTRKSASSIDPIKCRPWSNKRPTPKTTRHLFQALELESGA